MKINIETRFSIGDKVYLFINNEVLKSKISSISIDISKEEYGIFYWVYNDGEPLVVEQKNTYETLNELIIANNISKTELIVIDLFPA